MNVLKLTAYISVGVAVVCLVLAARTENRRFSSGWFVFGALLILYFVLAGCHHILEDLSDIQ